MRFRIINGYKNLDTGKDMKHVNRRIEYFHHYWKFLFAKNKGYLLISEEKFESHRSLLHKIELQFEHNPNRYAHLLNICLINHDYFSKNNIILKNSPKTLTRIDSLKSYFTNHFIRENGKVRNSDEICSRHIVILNNDIAEIKKWLLKGNYLKRILTYLSKELHKNKPLNASSKCDIKFLINAAIIELFILGYNLQFIESIPDIIIFPALKKSYFPFEKKRSEFKSPELYDEYVEEEIKNINLNKQINSLVNFSTQPKLKGYYVFRINGINFNNVESVKIWNTTFYNPQQEQKVCCFDYFQEYKNDVDELERYFETGVKEMDIERKKSTCNAIVEVERRPMYWEYPDRIYYSALDEVNKSLRVFVSLYSAFIPNHSKFSEVNLSKYIITDEKLNYLAAPTFIRNLNNPFEINGEQQSSFQRIQKGINKLNSNNEFHKKVMRIYSHLTHLQNNPLAFNFKDYWTIFCESLFPNSPLDYIEFSTVCIKSVLDYNMFVDAKIFLRDSLKRKLIGDGMPDYFLEDKAIKNLGLDYRLLKAIKAKKFKKTYSQLTTHLEFEFINDIINELYLYQNNYSKYEEIFAKWISKTIWEIYSERNLETHNDISSDLSALKLSESFILIANVVVRTILRYCNSKTQSVNDIKRQLDLT